MHVDFNMSVLFCWTKSNNSEFKPNKWSCIWQCDIFSQIGIPNGSFVKPRFCLKSIKPACLLVCWTYFFDPEDGGDKFLRNVGWNSTDYTASYSRRWYSSKPPLWKPQILQGFLVLCSLWGSHSCDYEEFDHLGFNTMQFGRSLPKFQSNVGRCLLHHSAFQPERSYSFSFC
jgi:hypothetical protein